MKNLNGQFYFMYLWSYGLLNCIETPASELPKTFLEKKCYKLEKHSLMVSL